MVERPPSFPAGSECLVRRYCLSNCWLQKQLDCISGISWHSQLLLLILLLLACPMTSSFTSSSSSSSSRRRGRCNSGVSSSAASPFCAADKTCVLKRLPENAASLASRLPCCDKEVLAYLMDFGHSNHPDGYLPSGWKPWKNAFSLSLASSPCAKFDAPFSSAFLSSRPSPHYPSLCCDCFACYCSFWAKWNSSDNRAIIDVVLDLFDSHLQQRRILERRRQGNQSSQKREEELGKNERGKSLVGTPIEFLAGPKEEEGSFSSGMPLELSEAGAMDGKGIVTSNHSPMKLQHQLVGKHKNSQVIPLNIEVCRAQEKEEISEDTEEEDASEVESVANANTIEEPRMIFGDASLRGRGFLDRVFPDALGGLASRLWNLVSVRTRSRDMDLY